MFTLTNTCVYMNSYPFINNKGHVHLCCKNNNHQLEGNIKTHKLKDIFFSDKMQRLREQMLREEPLLGCDICYTQEKRNEKSFRLRTLAQLQGNSNKMQPYPDVKIRHLDLRVGSLCNLMCTMCHPTDSSKWQQNYRTYANDVLQKSENHINIIESTNKPSDMDWANHDQSWDNIISSVDNNLQNVYMAGGEPFYIKKFPEYVTSLLEKIPTIYLNLNTNATRLVPDNYIKRLTGKLHIRISIDGYGPAEEYQRIGTNWKEKVEVMDQYYKYFDISSFDITLTNLTIRSLPNLVRFLEERYPNIPFMFRPVVNRPAQDIRLLETKLLKSTLNFCLELKRKAKNKWHYTNIDQIIAFCSEQKEGNLAELSRLVIYWDTLSQIKLEDFDRELADWIHANGSN